MNEQLNTASCVENTAQLVQNVSGEDVGSSSQHSLIASDRKSQLLLEAGLFKETFQFGDGLGSGAYQLTSTDQESELESLKMFVEGNVSQHSSNSHLMHTEVNDELEDCNELAELQRNIADPNFVENEYKKRIQNQTEVSTKNLIAVLEDDTAEFSSLFDSYTEDSFTESDMFMKPLSVVLPKLSSDILDKFNSSSMRNEKPVTSNFSIPPSKLSDKRISISDILDKVNSTSTTDGKTVTSDFSIPPSKLSDKEISSLLNEGKNLRSDSHNKENFVEPKGKKRSVGRPKGGTGKRDNVVEKKPKPLKTPEETPRRKYVEEPTPFQMQTRKRKLKFLPDGSLATPNKEDYTSPFTAIKDSGPSDSDSDSDTEYKRRKSSEDGEYSDDAEVSKGKRGRPKKKSFDYESYYKDRMKAKSMGNNTKDWFIKKVLYNKKDGAKHGKPSNFGYINPAQLLTQLVHAPITRDRLNVSKFHPKVLRALNAKIKSQKEDSAPKFLHSEVARTYSKKKPAIDNKKLKAMSENELSDEMMEKTNGLKHGGIFLNPDKVQSGNKFEYNVIRSENRGPGTIMLNKQYKKEEKAADKQEAVSEASKVDGLGEGSKLKHSSDISKLENSNEGSKALSFDDTSSSVTSTETTSAVAPPSKESETNLSTDSMCKNETSFGDKKALMAELQEVIEEIGMGENDAVYLKNLFENIDDLKRIDLVSRYKLFKKIIKFKKAHPTPTKPNAVIPQFGPEKVSIQRIYDTMGKFLYDSEGIKYLKSIPGGELLLPESQRSKSSSVNERQFLDIKTEPYDEDLKELDRLIEESGLQEAFEKRKKQIDPKVPKSIYTLMEELSQDMPSWNLHIMPDTNTFCLAQIARSRMGMPILKKSIELDLNFSAKVYVHQLHCKRFDGVYIDEASITNLIKEVDSLPA